MMLCVTAGNTVEQVMEHDSFICTFSDDTPLKDILGNPDLGAAPSIWRCDDNDDAAFDELTNLVLVHDGGAYDTEAAKAEVEAEERRWRREIAMEEGMLNGVQSFNDWMGY